MNGNGFKTINGSRVWKHIAIVIFLGVAGFIGKLAIESTSRSMVNDSRLTFMETLFHKMDNKLDRLLER